MSKRIYGAFPGGGSFTQVQSDWNETNPASAAFIKNKPTIPASGSVFLNDIPTPPAMAGFTWVNQGTATIVQTKSKAILLTMPSLGPLNWRLLTLAPPATPYKLRVLMRSYFPPASTFTCGIYFFDTVSQKMLALENLVNSGSNFLRAQRIVSPTVDGTQQAGTGANSLGSGSIETGIITSYQIRNNGTTLFLDYSIDAENYINLYSEAIGAFVTPNRIAWGGVNTGTGVNGYVSLIGWTVENNATL